ncbi:MAG: S8 family serine peptidase, partial [Pseudomonadota bacterium]
MSFCRYLALFLISFVLAACGGGGGSGGSSAGSGSPPAPTPTPATFSVSGLVAGDAALQVDSDTNDTAQPIVRNDSADSAQAISNPALVKGYVTFTPTNVSSDRFASVADPIDVYRVTLQAGQVLFLEFADFDATNPTAVDLDLGLFDSSRNLVAVSDHVNSFVEQIVVPTDGDYFVVVETFAGASSYSLTISSDLGTAAYMQVDLATLAPDRVNVAQAPKTDTLSTFANPSDARTFFAMADGKLDRGDLVAIVPELASTHDAIRQMAMTSGKAMPLDAVKLTSSELSLYSSRLEALRIVKMMNVEEGADVYKPYQYPTLLSDPVPDPALQWNLYDIEWPAAQDVLSGITLSKQPVIAVLDSGVLTNHPEIAPALVDQRDFVPAQFDGDGFDADASERVQLNDPDPGECYVFHGTHVSSTAVAPQQGEGITGVMPGAGLIAIKLGDQVSPNCGLIVGDLPGAIRYAAGLPNPSGELPPQPADVINMSLGGYSRNPSVEAAVRDAINAGVIVVASAGNGGQTSQAQLPVYPAAYDGVVAVAATDLRRQRAFYSSFYPAVDIAAPGGDLTVDENGDGVGDGIVAGGGSPSGGGFQPVYSSLQGTSMAAPHVAAGLALMRGIDPTLTPEQINLLIDEGRLTTDVAIPGRDNETGAGVMSLLKMVEVARQGASGAPVLGPTVAFSPVRVDFGSTLNSSTVDARAVGDGAIAISSFEVRDATIGGQTWLSASGSGLDANGLGSYILTANRAGLPPGIYRASVVFTLSNSDTKTLSVSLRQSAPAQTSSAPVFALLQRRAGDDFETVEQITAFGGIGDDILFSNISEGSYRIIYGTDIDSDDLICDAGELCGS